MPSNFPADALRLLFTLGVIYCPLGLLSTSIPLRRWYCTQPTRVHPRPTEPIKTNTLANQISSVICDIHQAGFLSVTARRALPRRGSAKAFPAVRGEATAGACLLICPIGKYPLGLDAEGASSKSCSTIRRADESRVLAGQCNQLHLTDCVSAPDDHEQTRWWAFHE